MTYDITHGVGGLWEVHRWTSAGGPVLNLNVHSDDARIHLVEIPGLHELPPVERQRSKKPGRHGVSSRQPTYGQKQVTYKGELHAPTLPELYALRTAALGAFSDLRPGTMEIIRDPGDPGPTAQFVAEVDACGIPDVITADEWVLDFTLQLTMLDPRFYFPELAVDETDGTAVEVTNTGSAPVDPIVTVEFTDVGQVLIEDGFTNVRTVTIDPADHDGLVVFDFTARQVFGGTGTVIGLDMTASQWWDEFRDGIAPGATVTITQAGGTSVQVQFDPASWG